MKDPQSVTYSRLLHSYCYKWEPIPGVAIGSGSACCTTALRRSVLFEDIQPHLTFEGLAESTYPMRGQQCSVTVTCIALQLSSVANIVKYELLWPAQYALQPLASKLQVAPGAALVEPWPELCRPTKQSGRETGGLRPFTNLYGEYLFLYLSATLLGMMAQGCALRQAVKIDRSG